MNRLLIPLVLVLVVVFAGGLVSCDDENQPEVAPSSSIAPTPPVTVPVVEPSLIFPWVMSDVGPVYAEETHYTKPSPDGRYLYVRSMDTRNIIVLDLQSRTIVSEIKMPGFWSQATEMIFSPDGRWLYTINGAAVGDRHIVVIDAQSKKIDHLIKLPKEEFPGEVGFTMSPDGRSLYVSLPGLHAIFKVDVSSEAVTQLSDRFGGNSFLTFTIDGKYILRTGREENSLDIIDPNNGNVVDRIRVAGSPCYVVESPDGHFAYLSLWESGEVAIVDLLTKTVVSTVPVGVNPLGMSLTPDGTKLYVAITAQSLEQLATERPWKVVALDTSTHAVIEEIGPVSARFLSISPDGARLYVNDYEGRVNVVDTSRDEIVDSMMLTRPASYGPCDVAVTPDSSKILVIARNTDEVLVIDRITGSILARFDAAGASSIAVSSDGKYAYLPGPQFVVLDIASLSVKYIPMAAIGGGERKIVLSPDNRIAYVAEANTGVLHIIDIPTWRLVASIPTGDMGVIQFDLAVTPDGEQVFVCNGRSKDISVVSTLSNKIIDTIQMESVPVAIDFSPDGRLAYVVDFQSDTRGLTTVVAIDVATRRIINRWDHEPVGFSNPWDVIVSRDAQRAYFAGTDGDCIVILDIGTGATRYIAAGLNPDRLALSEDGRFLFANSRNTDAILVIDTQTETVFDSLSLGAEDRGFLYVRTLDSSGRLIANHVPAVRFAPYEVAVQSNGADFTIALTNDRLDGCWVPLAEGDYMVWAVVLEPDLHLVNQVFEGISDQQSLAQATRVRVKKGQMTSVDIVLETGYILSGTLVDSGGNPVSAGGAVTNTRTGTAIGGAIGFGSEPDGSFWVVVPDGDYTLSFDGVDVAENMSVSEDIDLGKVVLNR